MFLLALTLVLNGHLIRFHSLLVVRTLRRLGNQQNGFLNYLHGHLFNFLDTHLRHLINSLINLSRYLRPIRPVRVAKRLHNTIPARIFLRTLIRPTFLLTTRIRMITRHPQGSRIGITMDRTGTTTYTRNRTSSRRRNSTFRPTQRNQILTGT